jgi:DNA protecting protein DprA
MTRNELIVRVMALQELPGVGPSSVHRLLKKFGSLSSIVSALEERSDDQEAVRRRSEDPLFKRVREAWANVELDRPKGWLAEIEDLGASVVMRGDEHFPENLKDVATLPALLYVKGSLRNLRTRSLALVGTTTPTPRGEARATKFAKLCTQHRIQIISGLARGIDATSHRAALESNTPTFACLGHGLRFLYPPEHKELADQIVVDGALVSQFPPDTRPTGWTFPARNELMCTMAKGTVIIEIEQGEKFGSVIQARFSSKHGRPVFVLRSNITELKSPVAAELVQSGTATEVADFKDVLAILEKSNPIFSPELNLTTPDRTYDAVPVESTPNEDSSIKSGAILFDMDGVFFDLFKIQPPAYAAAILAVTGKTIEHDAIRRHLHLSPYKLLQMYGAPWKAANEVYGAEFRRLVASVECMHDSVVAFMQRARRAGLSLGVVTHQPRQRADQVIRRAGLAELIDVTITYNDIPKGKGKPHPYPILRALEVLGVDPTDAVYVGDTPNDILAAREARVFSVAVGWGAASADDLRRWSPDMFASDPAELDELLTTRRIGLRGQVQQVQPK